MLPVEIINQSILYARLSLGAYVESPTSARSIEGLKKLKNEFRFEAARDTEGLAGKWNNDLVIAFRGTEKSIADIGTDVKLGLVKNKRGVGRLHCGFQLAADAAYQKVKRFIRNHTTDKSRVFLCGHSLGGALAVITASWLQQEKAQPNPRAVFTYGAPRVGDQTFVKSYRDAGLAKHTMMWVSDDDPVPLVPPFDFEYRHVTTKQQILTNGNHSVGNLDKAASRKHEKDWLKDVPAAAPLKWLARHLDDILTIDPAEHSIKKSYLAQLKKLKQTSR